MTNRTESRTNTQSVTTSMVKKSMAATTSRWEVRNVFPGDTQATLTAPIPNLLDAQSESKPSVSSG